MFRCGLSILVLLGFFANQLAMIPHNHAVDWPGHGTRPHIHLASSSHSHSHGHDHHHGHSHHGGSKKPVEQPQDSMEPLAEHDANALYVPGGEIHGVSASSLKCAKQTHSQQSLVSGAEFLDHVAASFWQPPPNDPHRSCPTFLRLRNLRI